MPGWICSPPGGMVSEAKVLLAHPPPSHHCFTADLARFQVLPPPPLSCLKTWCRSSLPPPPPTQTMVYQLQINITLRLQILQTGHSGALGTGGASGILQPQPFKQHTEGWGHSGSLVKKWVCQFQIIRQRQGSDACVPAPCCHVCLQQGCDISGCFGL